MLAVLVAVPTVIQNSLHPLSSFAIIDLPPSGFMVQGKIAEADASPHFMPNARSAATLPIYLGLGQASNNAGLHT